MCRSLVLNGTATITEVEAMTLEEIREWIETLDVAADADEHRRRHLKRPEGY